MRVSVDTSATQFLSRFSVGDALLITPICPYSMPGTVLTVERRHLQHVQRDPDLVRHDTSFGVPIYAHRRLAAYAAWNPLRLTTRGAGWWRDMALVDESTLWKRVLQWERLHPGLCTKAGEPLDAE